MLELELGLIGFKSGRSWVSREKGLSLGHETVKGIAGFNESPFTLETKVLNVLEKQDLAEAAGERE